ncbi:MAG: hypothetical protein M3M89_01925, partial [Thermoproteota archaeon]|nr:hypothetical protein [Thermoproteota archaeon]
MLTIPKQIASNCNYYSVGALVCIILLLLGSVQHYYPYMANLSSDNTAYGQEQSVEAEDDPVAIERVQEESVVLERSENTDGNNDTAALTIPREEVEEEVEEVEEQTGEDIQPPREEVEEVEEVEEQTGEDIQPPHQQVQPPPHQQV